jgi:leucyl-tRNA synthetase
MNATAGDYAGLPVMEAKVRMKQAMIASGEAAVMYDLSENVTCRCGERVVIKKVDDQWFIDYANPEVTAASKEQAKNMESSLEYYQNIHGVLDWFRERACVRQGNWIGTSSPSTRNGSSRPSPIPRSTRSTSHIQVRQRRIDQGRADDRGVLRPCHPGQG